MYYKVNTIDEIVAYIGDCRLIAIDIETSPMAKWRDTPKAALDPHKSDITGISFSIAEDSGIYVPLRHKIGINANPDEIMQWLDKNVFQDKEVTLVCHNLAFECSFFYALGFVPTCKVYDTIAASQMTLKSNTGFRKLSDSGLKTLVPELLDVSLPTFTEVTDGRHFDELNPQDTETIRYACADADCTLRLYHIFNGWFDKWLPKHRAIVEQIESPTAVYCGLMKYNGLLVDETAMIRKQGEAATKLIDLQEQIRSLIGDVDIGVNASTKAFKAYLFQQCGLPVMKTTAKNAEAADDETMILLAEWCAANRPELVPLFEVVQEYRRFAKIKATYIDGYLRYVNPITGCIHPDLLPLATETGRFAARNPNLQNCPRKSNDPIGVRSFVIARPEHVLVSCDFSQIELRVGAFYCRDAKMLDTYRTGGDIHNQTADVVFGVRKHDKEERTIAKNVNFGTFFGLYPSGLQRTLRFKAGLNKSLPECEAIIANLKAGYPALSRWQDHVKRQVAQNHYTQTYLGRRRYLPGIASQDWNTKSYAERCALNTPIQGTAADILKLALGRLVMGLPERPWLRPLLQVHDEVIFEVPADKQMEAVSFIRTCMETQPFPAFDVPIVAEAVVGLNFGNMAEVGVST